MIAELIERKVKQIPYGIANRLAMGVDQDILACVIKLNPIMTGQMILTDQIMSGERLDIGLGLKALILGTDIDIIDIEQEFGACVSHKFDEKFRLAHLIMAHLDIGRWIFNQNGASHRLLEPYNIASHGGEAGAG